MALNIGEADAVNTVVKRLLGIEDPTGKAGDDEKVIAAAELLADKAHKALGAGINGSTVHTHRWSL